MKPFVLFIMLLSGCSAFSQELKHFERVSKELLRAHLAEQFDWYQKTFKAKKHLEWIDTPIIEGKVQHLSSNLMAGMPGELRLYKVQLEAQQRYLLIEELAAPLGGYFDIYLFNDQWEELDRFSFSAKYTAPKVSFYLSPKGNVLLSTESEFYRSVYPHKGLSIVEVDRYKLNLCFQAYIHFINTDDATTDTCEEKALIKLSSGNLVLDSIAIKRTSWCAVNSLRKASSGLYAWNPQKNQYTLAFNDFQLDTLLIVSNIELPVLFDLNSDSIRGYSEPMLDSFALFLKTYPSVRVEVRVHFDTRWSDIYATRLDQNRAESIANYLIEAGVDKDQVSAKGMGDYDPIVTEQEIAAMETEEEKERAQQRNRRIEVQVLSR